jgi:hypothetical protein
MPTSAGDQVGTGDEPGAAQPPASVPDATGPSGESGPAVGLPAAGSGPHDERGWAPSGWVLLLALLGALLLGVARKASRA